MHRLDCFADVLRRKSPGQHDPPSPGGLRREAPVTAAAASAGGRVEEKTLHLPFGERLQLRPGDGPHRLPDRIRKRRGELRGLLPVQLNDVEIPLRRAQDRLPVGVGENADPLHTGRQSAGQFPQPLHRHTARRCGNQNEADVTGPQFRRQLHIAPAGQTADFHFDRSSHSFLPGDGARIRVSPIRKACAPSP